MMKLILPALFGLALFTYSCDGGKKINLDKSPYLKIEGPYWRKFVSGQQDGKNSILLVFPYAFPVESYKVDSVYFMGYHEQLRQGKLDNKEVYRSRFIMDDTKEKIMAPVELEEDQALVSYLNKEAEKHYFIVDNIVEAEAIYMP